MNNYILTLIDVRQVQRYLFNANELKQNLGASFLVEMACRQWVQESLPNPHNWPDPKLDEFSSTAIESKDIQAEVIFSGGANAAILFTDEGIAKEFAQRYTRLVVERAPGLEVAIGHTEVVWDDPNGLKNAWENMQNNVMPRRKEGRMNTMALQGLSVTAECAFTGKPSVIEIKDESGVGRLYSSEALAKHENSPRADYRLKTALGIDPPIYEYPNDFEHLGGERGQARYIAVIHADGNGLGNRIKHYTEQATTNRDAVKRMRDFSREVNWAGYKALEDVRDWLLKALSWNSTDSSDRLVDRWQEENFIQLKNNYFPLRPIVYGGDDVTLVCDGRLGLPIAGELIKAFANKKLPDNQPIYACAGVAIVHSHFPFARAYALAEKLCHQAKIAAHEFDKEKRLGLLHWYYTLSGRTLEDWKEIQEFDYKVKAGSLTLRPIMVVRAVNANHSTWRTWDGLTSLLKAFRKSPWANKRNKVKELGSALRAGPEAVRKFTDFHGKLPEIKALPANSDYQSTGWYNDYCLYFDALEAHDLFVYPQYGGEA